LILLYALALLIIPPAVLITAFLRWLTLLVPAGIAAFIIAIERVILVAEKPSAAITPGLCKSQPSLT